MNENCLDKYVLITLLGLASKTRDFEIYKRYNVAFFHLKCEKAQNKRDQRVETIEKIKKIKKMKEVRRVDKAIAKIR